MMGTARPPVGSLRFGETVMVMEVFRKSKLGRAARAEILPDWRGFGRQLHSGAVPKKRIPGARHMFIGHYGVSLAVKRYEPRISLGILFLAVQFLDILFATFVLLNIEHMRIVPGFTKFNPYDLYYMPYSHSLLGSLLWSVLVALIYWWVFRPWDSGSKGAAILGLAVFSHFLLDVPMHVHDLPLLMSESSATLGLRFCNHRNLSLLAEAVCFVGGAVPYVLSTQEVSDVGHPLITSCLLVLDTVG